MGTSRLLSPNPPPNPRQESALSLQAIYYSHIPPNCTVPDSHYSTYLILQVNSKKKNLRTDTFQIIPCNGGTLTYR